VLPYSPCHYIDVVTSSNLFDALSSTSGGRLPFPVYDKYLAGLDRSDSLLICCTHYLVQISE
jgi:hypothetical protein